tara:strand:+ start:998 stop:2473 length:1476 start_codon:yes stop_codon:yes gene_type:complete
VKKTLLISIFSTIVITASCGSNETNTSSINDNENISLKSEINTPSTVTIKETPSKTPLKESLVKKAEKITEKVQIKKTIIPTPEKSFRKISTPISKSILPTQTSYDNSAAITPKIPTPTPTPTATPTPLPNPDKMTHTESLCEDRKDYVYCTSSEAIVAPFTQLDWESGWGVEKGYSPEVFCASDLQETVCPAVTSSLLAAMIEWGSYEPVEYWVLGTEKEAASKLTNINCERRENRGQEGMDDCLRKHGPEGDYGFDYYRRIGEERLENGFGSSSAAHIGHDEWGFHLFASSITFGFTDLFQPIDGAVDQKIIIHEYFHAIQSSHMGLGGKRESLKGSDWFVEGGAEYMAEIKLKKAIDTKLLKPIYGSKPYVLRDNMEDHMLRAIDNLSNNCPGNKLQDLNYENQCDILYSLGSWAMAYLAHVYGEDLLLESFYKNLTEKPNWEVAFNDTYGISLEEFYVDFDKFLKLQGSDYDLFHEILGNMEYRILE